MPVAHSGDTELYWESTGAGAPVLLVMGLAQCKPEEKWIRVVYVAAFFLVLFYTEVPWTALLVDWQAS